MYLLHHRWRSNQILLQPGPLEAISINLYRLQYQSILIFQLVTIPRLDGIFSDGTIELR